MPAIVDNFDWPDARFQIEGEDVEWGEGTDFRLDSYVTKDGPGASLNLIRIGDTLTLTVTVYRLPEGTVHIDMDGHTFLDSVLAKIRPL